MLIKLKSLVEKRQTIRILTDSINEDTANAIKAKAILKEQYGFDVELIDDGENQIRKRYVLNGLREDYIQELVNTDNSLLMFPGVMYCIDWVLTKLLIANTTYYAYKWVPSYRDPSYLGEYDVESIFHFNAPVIEVDLE